MKPFSGIKVIDWSEGVAGPYACQILSDLGAEVIKVEQPRGDWGRFMGGNIDKASPSFKALNRNKRSICIQVKSKKGLEIIKSLISKADILVTSYRPGVIERLGLNLNTIIEMNPKIIYGRISAYGNKGELSSLPGSDTVIQAISGLMSHIGEFSSTPYRVGVPIIDLIAAKDLVIGLQSCLMNRFIGENSYQIVDVNLFSSATAILTQSWQNFFENGTPLKRAGNLNPALSPAGVYETKDNKYLSVAVLNDTHWKNFCVALEIEYLCNDQKFSSNEKRLEHREELEEIVKKKFKLKNRSEWLNICRENDVLVAPVYSIKEIENDKQLRSIIPIVQLPINDDSESKNSIGLPIQFNEESKVVTAKRSAPNKGEHSKEILQELGFSTSEITKLYSNGVVL